jgi:hypothetical protein
MVWYLAYDEDILEDNFFKVLSNCSHWGLDFNHSIESRIGRFKNFDIEFMSPLIRAKSDFKPFMIKRNHSAPIYSKLYLIHQDLLKEI